MGRNDRLAPSIPFPKYRFLPGKNAHPSSETGHSAGQPDPVADPLILSRTDTNPALRFALDLFNDQYFWESHVYFEAIWNAEARSGSNAAFLKGMIKLGAAFVKFKLGHTPQAQVHLERAREIFVSLMQTESEKFLGFNLKEIISQIDTSIATACTPFTVYPEWK
jgi:hypothetical protein